MAGSGPILSNRDANFPLLAAIINGDVAMKILLTVDRIIGSAFARLALSRGHQIGGLLIPDESIPTSWCRAGTRLAPWHAGAGAGRRSPILGPRCASTPLGLPRRGFTWSRRRTSCSATPVAVIRQLRKLGVNHMGGLGTCIEYQITDRPLSEDHPHCAHNVLCTL